MAASAAPCASSSQSKVLVVSSILLLAVPSQIVGQSSPASRPPEYQVEAILDNRFVPVTVTGSGKEQTHILQRQYLVKWWGYSAAHNSWEPEGNCEHCAEAVAAYWGDRVPERPTRQRTAKLGK